MDYVLEVIGLWVVVLVGVALVAVVLFWAAFVAVSVYMIDEKVNKLLKELERVQKVHE